MFSCKLKPYSTTDYRSQEWRLERNGKISTFTENTNRNKKARQLLLKGFCHRYPESGDLQKVDSAYGPGQ